MNIAKIKDEPENNGQKDGGEKDIVEAKNDEVVDATKTANKWE